MAAPGPKNKGSRILPALLWGAVSTILLSEPASAQTALLSQPPSHLDSHLSDARLQDFPTLPNPTGACVADNFVLSSQKTIARIRIWGIYFGGTAPATDNFTVVIHTDAAGLPGTALSTQHNVPATRRVTGEMVGTWAEHVYTLMPNPATLAPGTYWVEVCNDTTGNPSSFYWEFGATDPLHGIPGAAFTLTAIPGSGWQVVDIDSNRQDLAIEMTAQPVTAAVPTLAGWGLAFLSAFLGASGLHFLRRCAGAH